MWTDRPGVGAGLRPAPEPWLPHRAPSFARGLRRPIEEAMGCSCCDFRDAADRQFTAPKAAKELQVYRRGRLGPTTRLLRDGIVDVGLNRGSLLDIGGGIGALTFELLDRGMATAAVVEDLPLMSAQPGEGVRRGHPVHGDRARRYRADRGQAPLRLLVTLDRVVCCYPSYELMLAEATRHAERGVAVSYPMDRWFVRAGTFLENAMRAGESGFRTFVHPPARIQQVIARAGFQLARRRTTAMWAIDIFVRAV